MRALPKANGTLAQLLGAQPDLYDNQSLQVDLTRTRWKLNSVSRGRGATLNWGACGEVDLDVARGMIEFMRFNVERKSADHCVNAFRDLASLTRLAEERRLNSPRSLLFAYLAELRFHGSEWRFHYVREWYRWCADQDLPGFDDFELYYELTSLRIPGNIKGDAVRSEDPSEGPLDDLEEMALRDALVRDQTIPLLERAVTWSLLSLGCNPANLLYLCESDFKVVRHDDNAFFSLDVPRIKKRVDPRSQFKCRKLDAALATIIASLIEENIKLEIPLGFSRPIFARKSPRLDCLGTPIEKYAYHYTSGDIKDILKRCVRRLGVVSPRTRQPLRVTPRRLRYTFATQKVQEGCSMEALADLLDHTDLQHVMVYYSGRGLTKKLDEALAVTVGPLVNRFMGRVIGEDQAEDLGGTVKAQPLGRIVDIGTCGSATLCNLFPPASCYLCPLFQPWRNGPHRDVLVDLIQRRDARISETGRPDDRMAQQLNEMIVAVGQVVSICEATQ